MAGVRIEVESDDAALQASFRRLTATLDDLRPVMDRIGQSLVTSVIDRFKRERGPGGAPWKPSARAVRGKRGKGQTLTDTGRLRASITYRAGRDQVEVGANVAYAAIHQFGGQIERRAAQPGAGLSRPGRRVRIAQIDPSAQGGGGAGGASRKSEPIVIDMPARPFLGLDDGDRRSILKIVSRAIERAVA